MQSDILIEVLLAVLLVYCYCCQVSTDTDRVGAIQGRLNKLPILNTPTQADL